LMSFLHRIVLSDECIINRREKVSKVLILSRKFSVLKELPDFGQHVLDPYFLGCHLLSCNISQKMPDVN